MPTNPQMDEGQILNLLQGPISLHLVPRLNAGCLLAVLASYDRKTTRDAFQHIMEQAFDLQKSIIRLQTLELIKQIMSKETFAKEMQDNLEYTEKTGENQRKNLEFSVKMVSECAWETDPIN